MNWKGFDLEGNGNDPVELLSHHRLEGLKKKHENSQSRQPISRSKFEPSTFLIQAQEVPFIPCCVGNTEFAKM
jgi:hypothetical protein